MVDEGDPNDGGGFGIAFDLDDDAAPKKPAAPPPQPSRPQGPQGLGPQGLPQQRPLGGPVEARLPQGMGGGFPQQPQGGMPGMGMPMGPMGEADPNFVPVDIPPTKTFGDQAADVARIAAVHGKVVAEKTREVAINVAGKTRDVAVKAAVQSIGGDGQHKVIRLEDPSTWLKPMRGPLIALGLAILVSLLAVVVGKATGMKLAVGWISGPLLLGAIVFAVIRWIRLQE